MTAIYVRWIKASRMSLEDVPLRWRDDVAKKLSEQEAQDAGNAPDEVVVRNAEH